MSTPTFNAVLPGGFAAALASGLPAVPSKPARQRDQPSGLALDTIG